MSSGEKTERELSASRRETPAPSQGRREGEPVAGYKIRERNIEILQRGRKSLSSRTVPASSGTCWTGDGTVRRRGEEAPRWNLRRSII